MINRIFKNTLTVTAFVALSTTGFSAVGAKTYQERSVTVNHADLDLTKSGHRWRLDSRIKVAVQRICGKFPGPRLGADRGHKQCMNDAFESARVAKDVAVMNAKDGKPSQTAFVIRN